MSQKYTEVEWQDPAGGNPGTLINKARLDQMQTAHHFADGLEEVDAVPTANPGVNYHKIVYCTADSTLYRWDGTQWQKDIDDDTKALLLAHEADHANPHQVTKAQVGLGNADNTADADKPVSTATQTALDGKVSIIPVTTGVKFYAQTSGGTYLYQGTQDATAGITSVPLRDSSGRIRTATPSGDTDAVPKKYADDGLATKADKATTYTKTETDTLLAGKADKATTLAGYGITDAYTKTEADTLLGAKADKATTYTKTEIDNSVVKLTGAQTIQGIKTFTSAMTLNNDLNISMTRPTITGICGYALDTRGSSDSTATFMDMDRLYDNNNQYIRENTVKNYATFREYTIGLHDKYENTAKDGYITLRVSAKDNYAYMTAPTRAYSAGNTTDVATIGTLDAYTPMVRTTGAQTIGGQKTFQNIRYNTGLPGFNEINFESTTNIDVNPAEIERHGLQLVGPNGAVVCRLFIGRNTNGEIELRLDATMNGTYKSVTIAKLTP